MIEFELRMRIIFFSRLFYPHIGGVEKHVLKIGEIMVEKGLEIIVFTEQYAQLNTLDNVDGIKIIRVPVGKEDKLKKFRIWWNLLKYINVIKSADIVHCHDIFFWYLPFRFIFPFKKVYTTFHGYEGNFIPTKKAILMHKIAEKLSWGNICVGSFISKWYMTKPNLITYGAVDKQLIVNGRKNNRPYKDIVFIGRLEQETGVMDYIELIKELKRQKINLNLDIFGDGSLRNKILKETNDNKLNINIKGFVANAADFIEDYKFVFTSRYLGILESLALKRPVFAMSNNEIKKDYLEMADFSNFIFIANNVGNMIKIFRLNMLNKRNPNLNKGYEWVKNKTWDKLVKKYFYLWKI